MTAPDNDPLIGQRLNEYEVKDFVAAGGMGVVYRGVHPVIGKRAAIKVLKAVTENSDEYEALVLEAQAANSIGHRNIVDIFGIGRLADSRPYIIMEFLEGKALDARLAEGKPSLLEAVQLLFDMCAPLSAAHKAQVIHRDLKPSNVFLCAQPDGGTFLKLLDFGLAKKAMRLDGVTEQTARTTVAGTPDYMAPEQAQGKPVSSRTDLYALGCIGYELVTGQVPFSAATPFDVMVAQVRSPVPRASTLAPSLPKELDDLLFRLMAKQPEDRPANADELRDALFPILEELGAASAQRGPRTISSELVVMKARASGQREAVRTANAKTDVFQPAPTTEAALDPVVAGSGREPAEAVAASPADQPLPDQPVSHSPRPRRWVVPAALATLSLVLVLALGFARSDPATSETAEPPPTNASPPRKAPPPVEPIAAAAPPQVPPAPIPTETPQVPDGDELTPLPNELTTAKREQKPEAKPAPTEAELKKRVASLETRLRARTPAGESPNPAAIQVLQKYRVQLTLSDSPASRTKLGRQLDQWEKLFLAR